MEESEIREYFAGKCALITGGTGFLGKVLIETLLRNCPDIDTIYVLVRSSKCQPAHQRLASILESELFDWLRKEREESLAKVVGLEGDMAVEGLALTREHHNLLRDTVSVIFHCAANVRFTESIKKSIQTNVLGTRYVLNLAKDLRQLQALVHVSTAYCNCNQREILEKIYKTPRRPSDLINLVEILEEDVLASITPRLLGDWPNTYTFSKALAENLIEEEKGDLPVAILRPSIVSATWRGEAPGWIDNMNGVTGGIVAYSRGLLRNLCVNRNDIVDLVPVDYVANAALAVAWHTGTLRKTDLEVYNVTSKLTNGLRWGHFGLSIKHFTQNYPPSKVIWYTTGRLRSNMIINKIYSLIQQTIPAALLDTMSYLTGHKPIFLKLVKKMDKAFEVGHFGMSKTFVFSSNNTDRLYNALNEHDKNVFSFNTDNIKWNEYIKIYYLGVRKYIMKEEMATLPEAKSNLNRKYWIHQMMKMILLWALIHTFIKTGPTLSKIWQKLTV